jgi:hypothetical protein
MDPHSFKEDLGSISRCDILLTGCEDGHLQKQIDVHKYTIIALLGGWKAKYIIHQDGFPRIIGSRKRGV